MARRGEKRRRLVRNGVMFADCGDWCAGDLLIYIYIDIEGCLLEVWKLCDDV